MDGTHATAAWTRSRQSSATIFRLSELVLGPFGPGLSVFCYKGCNFIALVLVDVVSEKCGEINLLL